MIIKYQAPTRRRMAKMIKMKNLSCCIEPKWFKDEVNGYDERSDGTDCKSGCRYTEYHGYKY